MDKIWYRNPSKSEVIGRICGDEKNEWPRRTDKSRTLKNPKKNTFFEITHLWIKKHYHFQLELLKLFNAAIFLLVPLPDCVFYQCFCFLHYYVLDDCSVLTCVSYSYSIMLLKLLSTFERIPIYEKSAV